MAPKEAMCAMKAMKATGAMKAMKASVRRQGGSKV